jgi:hypothetical protein
VRLSPKSVFLGLIVLGLPFAMALGWRLADHPSTVAALRAPAGSGAFGAAPVQTRTARSAPIARADAWPAEQAPDPTGAAPTPEPHRTATIPPPAATETTGATGPPLGLPPVPTPTDVTSSSASPSPSPSPSESTDPELLLFNQAHWPASP